MQISFSEQDQQQLIELEVVAIYLFGSRALGVETPLSDFDFAVLMATGGDARGNKLYDQLYDILSPHCLRTLQNDVIDIVFLRDVSLELRMHVVRYGKVIFDRIPAQRLAFEAEISLLYADFKPMLDEFDQTILKRYATP